MEIEAVQQAHHMAVAVATPDIQEAPAAQPGPESPNHALERTALSLTRSDATGVTALIFFVHILLDGALVEAAWLRRVHVGPRLAGGVRCNGFPCLEVR